MSSVSPSADTDRIEYDPVFLHSRREAIVVFFVWFAALLWAVPYCYLNGYMRTFDPENFQTIWGMPDWVFWGIVAPWLAADVVTTIFCFGFMKDDDLGEAHEDADVEAEIAERHAAQAAREEAGE